MYTPFFFLSISISRQKVCVCIHHISKTEPRLEWIPCCCWCWWWWWYWCCWCCWSTTVQQWNENEMKWNENEMKYTGWMNKTDRPLKLVGIFIADGLALYDRLGIIHCNRSFLPVFYFNPTPISRCSRHVPTSFTYYYYYYKYIFIRFFITIIIQILLLLLLFLMDLGPIERFKYNVFPCDVFK